MIKLEILYFLCVSGRPGEITPPPCADKLRNCHQYGPNTCATYAPWAKDNCRQYCNLCSKCRAMQILFQII